MQKCECENIEEIEQGIICGNSDEGHWWADGKCKECSKIFRTDFFTIDGNLERPIVWLTPVNSEW